MQQHASQRITSRPPLEIIKQGDPRLEEYCLDVDKTHIQRGLHSNLVNRMRELLKTEPAIGLSAPQLGMMIRLIVVEDTLELMKHLSIERRQLIHRSPIGFHVLFNPVVIPASERIKYYFEGCTSYPGIVGVVARPFCIKVDYVHFDGYIVTNSMWTGWPARIVSHEVDHLNGMNLLKQAIPGSIMNVNDFLEKWKDATSDQIKARFAM